QLLGEGAAAARVAQRLGLGAQCHRQVVGAGPDVADPGHAGHRVRAARLRPRRRRIVAEIDSWADLNLARSAVGARAHIETLGQTIDHIAAAAATAFHVLNTDDPAGILMHRHWTRLAELEVAYGDLVRDIRDGRRYLPTARTARPPVSIAAGHECGWNRTPA
uniref:DUF4254 domain-containing protein n=1 Tax=Nocardia wallacei TaxID=480035 RepID=UPI002453AFFE